MNNSEYWESRIAENTWGTYNSLEEKNRALLEMYQEASLDISEELYKVTEKINQGKGITISDMYKFNRLDNLQKNFENAIRSLGEKVESFGKENMMEGFKDTYSNVMTELGQIDFALPNQKLMENMMNRPWQGGTFSERLWKNTQVLASNLNDILTSGLTQGKTVTEMAIQLNNRMNEGFNVSHRLVRTETMHYLNESAFMAYKDGGCEQVQIWAAIDERTCPTCGAKHGNIYSMKDRPSLPLHANCRCTYLPVIDKEDAKRDKAIAEENVKKEMDRREIPEEQIKDKMLKNKASDIKQFNKYKEVLGNEMPKSFDKFRDLKYNDSNKWNEIKSSYAKTNRFNKIVKESSKLHIKGNVIKDIDKIDISEYKFAETHIFLERGHNVTKEIAQEYINNAEIAYSRWNGEVTVYLSKDGCSVVNLKDKIISTAYKSAEYDEKFKNILEVINDD